MIQSTRSIDITGSPPAESLWQHELPCELLRYNISANLSFRDLLQTASACKAWSEMLRHNDTGVPFLAPLRVACDKLKPNTWLRVYKPYLDREIIAFDVSSSMGQRFPMVSRSSNGPKTRFQIGLAYVEEQVRHMITRAEDRPIHCIAFDIRCKLREIRPLEIYENLKALHGGVEGENKTWQPSLEAKIVAVYNAVAKFFKSQLRDGGTSFDALARFLDENFKPEGCLNRYVTFVSDFDNYNNSFVPLLHESSFNVTCMPVDPDNATAKRTKENMLAEWEKLGEPALDDGSLETPVDHDLSDDEMFGWPMVERSAKRKRDDSEQKEAPPAKKRRLELSFKAEVKPLSSSSESSSSSSSSSSSVERDLDDSDSTDTVDFGNDFEAFDGLDDDDQVAVYSSDGEINHPVKKRRRQ